MTKSGNCFQFSPYTLIVATVLSFYFISFQAVADENLKSVGYQRIFPGLTFTSPTLLIQQVEDDQRFYVLEKSGRIYYFENHPDVTSKILFLDISEERVDESSEGGLLGMAFDPDFKNNHFIYLSYTSSESPEKDNSSQLISRISRFKTNPENTAVIPESEDILLTINQPWNNHNGGHIVFGPDGYLYAGYGDGGSWGDPNRNAQNLSTLLGSLLRIDVSTASQENREKVKYRIPGDNPFAASESCENNHPCPEIFAWGLRNPWRWSFDKITGDLWLADVGQGEWEEIDKIVNGGNYGWNCYEGNADYRLNLCNRNQDLIMPVFDYAHLPSDSSRDGKAASVTGGYIYRGKDVPALNGKYIYADFMHGKIWALLDPNTSAPRNIELFDTDIFIVSFAEDNQGELYFINHMGNGEIYKFISSAN